MRKSNILLLTVILFILFSCTKEKTGPPVVTKLICYDVQLRNPDSLPDVWQNYMDDSTRLAFLKKIIDPVLAGENEAWIWEDQLKKAPVEELKKRFAWDNAVPFPDTLDPINYRVDLNRISNIRYWEEWKMHRKSLQIDKRVMGIALILDNYDEEGTFRGTEPLFYVFYDKELPGMLENKRKKAQ